MKLTQRQLRKLINKETQRLNENKRVKAIARRADKRLNEQRLSSLSNSQGMQGARQMIQSSSADAVKIYKALKGLGTDEDAVYAVLNKRQNSIPALYQEYNVLMMELKQGESGFMAKVKKYGLPFLAGSGLFALATMIDPKKAAGVASAVGKQVANVKRRVGDYQLPPEEMEALYAQAAEDHEAGIDTAATIQVQALDDEEVKRKALAGEMGAEAQKAVQDLQDRIKTAAPDFAREDEVIQTMSDPDDMKSGAPGTTMTVKGGLSTGGKIGGALLTGAAFAAVAGLISAVIPDSLDDDLVDWLEDDGMDDAAQFVLARLAPGQRAR